MSSSPSGTTEDEEDSHWSAIGIYDSSVVARLNIRTDDDVTLDSPYQDSTPGNTDLDFVVSNANHWGFTTHYAEVFGDYTGPHTPYDIETEWSVLDPVLGLPYSGTMPRGEVLDMYELSLIEGELYQLTLEWFGTTDLAAYVFSPIRASGSAMDFDFKADDKSEWSRSESVVFSATASGDWGIVIVNQNRGYVVGEYTLTVDTWPGPFPLVNDTPVTFSDSQKDFFFEMDPGMGWHGVAINPTTDYNLEIDENSDFSSVYEASSLGGTTRDFVVTNARLWGSITQSDPHYARVDAASPGTCIIEADSETYLRDGYPYLGSMDSGEVIDIFRVYMRPEEVV